MILTYLAKKGLKTSELRKSYPEYVITKNRIDLTEEMDVDAILKAVELKHSGEQVTNIDGVKIDFADGWVHLRKSNTEPIIRVYSEAETEKRASDLAKMIMDEIDALMSK